MSFLRSLWLGSNYQTQTRSAGQPQGTILHFDF